MPYLWDLANESYNFVRSIIEDLGNYLCHSAAADPSECISHIPVPERAMIAEIRLDCRHSICYNSKTKQYTLIAPAPPIKNIVISGGGAKGVILTGVLEAFDSFKTSSGSFRDQIDNIAGSSIGAITAALIAAGMPSERFTEVTRNTDFKQLLGKGIGPIRLDGKPILTFLRTHLRESIGNHLRALYDSDELSAVTKERIEARLPHLAESDRTSIAQGVIAAIHEVMKNEVDDVRITFGMLHSLHRMCPEIFKDLTVTATCKQNGLLCYFDAARTPNLDIALGCRASGSLPLVLTPVAIERRMLLPGYSDLLPAREMISFVDGGYIDNIPVDVFEEKQSGKEGRGVFDQNLQTLALVFDTSNRGEGDQSPYHDEMVQNSAFLNPRSFIERVMRDLLPRRVGGINTSHRNTVLARKGQDKIRKVYTLRSIPLLVSLNAVDFKKAKLNEELYRKRGYQQAIEYLENHVDELLYHTSDNLDSLLDYLPVNILHSFDLESIGKDLFSCQFPEIGEQ